MPVAQTRTQWETESAVSVPAAGTTDLFTFDVSNQERIYVQIHVATQALDAFIITANSHSDSSSTFETLYSTAGEYASPTGILQGTSGDLTAIAAGAVGWFIMDVHGIYEIKLQASAAADSASVTIYAGGS